ncbi:phosphoglucomutase (alpha-D-glucose-1,6-bisphosphate-dependent) [Brevibacterium casei]|uniref:Alpha-D-glucose phosphate-specific phosphoglucomutase n=1 Tax=Brevibacterium casei TaxID=33889 RepID=A0A7T2TJ66_9MICO|nr:phosphoglucomutase (alpha-D-glucose-1,6-bisphosphate-dependent) [Brevibacterium casei]MCT1551291.1 phosphoglucomutase (alpha-D-glucose-1,6-bisphosphate-dependent) [Brevibacterium casei]MCT1560630.1 phosphoglucomutase (alpha-D-glucose-1,6-bisphosphate-dependent) [Brevibacterium casei]MCT2209101.1 phosphoglucomutase (alpha-D-glucose-1,6-bisphosphate-dependent) [Brevibacterium casei]QPS34847.1 alpha-D-glucose phosphate-specific phosphoglucomutase [Brevibacterium casei]
MTTRAGQLAQDRDLIDVPALLDSYYDLVPDPSVPGQAVSFGTSGHRGSSFNRAFNEAHIAAITAAIVDYRKDHGVRGPIFLGRDTHALSEPAFLTALEVLAAADVPALIDERDGYTPTPALSHAILGFNAGKSIGDAQADGIIITPSHNPPADGGIKYNPPHGGPAGTEATKWIADRANAYLEAGWEKIPRTSFQRAFHLENTENFDFISNYVGDLSSVIDMDLIRDSGLRIGADPLGGASVDYWAAIAEDFDLNLTVVHPDIDPTFSFMTLDWDENIRMDCSSPFAMAGLIASRGDYDIATGNDADADRHGIVTPDAGLMNPNHYLAAAIDYLLENRPDWPAEAAIGKTLVTSSIVDRVVAAHGRRLFEVPVGFKWFVPGLLDSTLAFGGEESAGASFLRRGGKVWSTDKDGIILALLASEMTAKTGQTPSQRYAGLAEKFGTSAYARQDAPANREQKARLGALEPSQVTASTIGGEDVTSVLTTAPGNDAPIGGLKVTTDNAWFAVRPSGTEDVYKIYAESLRDEDHLRAVQHDARSLVDGVLGKQPQG